MLLPDMMLGSGAGERFRTRNSDHSDTYGDGALGEGVDASDRQTFVGIPLSTSTAEICPGTQGRGTTGTC